MRSARRAGEIVGHRQLDLADRVRPAVVAERRREVDVAHVRAEVLRAEVAEVAVLVDVSEEKPFFST
jgi:hypothetical protein